MKKITKTTFISFNNKMKKMDFIPPYNKLDDAIMEMTGGYQLTYENKSNPSKVIINTDNKFNIEDIILYTEYEPIEIWRFNVIRASKGDFHGIQKSRSKVDIIYGSYWYRKNTDTACFIGTQKGHICVRGATRWITIGSVGYFNK